MSSDPAGSPVCPICATALEARAVKIKICPACETPHHSDCWDYATGCSTFGCRLAPPGRPAGGAPPKPAGGPVPSATARAFPILLSPPWAVAVLLGALLILGPAVGLLMTRPVPHPIAKGSRSPSPRAPPSRRGLAPVSRLPVVPIPPVLEPRAPCTPAPVGPLDRAPPSAIVRWTRRLPGTPLVDAVAHPMLESQGLVVIATGVPGPDGRTRATLTSLSPDTGAVAWTVALDDVAGAGDVAAVALPFRVLMMSRRGGITVLDRRTGAVVSRTPLEETPGSVSVLGVDVDLDGYDGGSAILGGPRLIVEVRLEPNWPFLRRPDGPRVQVHPMRTPAGARIVGAGSHGCVVEESGGQVTLLRPRPDSASFKTAVGEEVYAAAIRPPVVFVAGCSLNVLSHGAKRRLMAVPLGGPAVRIDATELTRVRVLYGEGHLMVLSPFDPASVATGILSCHSRSDVVGHALIGPGGPLDVTVDAGGRLAVLDPDEGRLLAAFRTARRWEVGPSRRLWLEHFSAYQVVLDPAGGGFEVRCHLMPTTLDPHDDGRRWPGLVWDARDVGGKVLWIPRADARSAPGHR